MGEWIVPAARIAVPVGAALAGGAAGAAGAGRRRLPVLLIHFAAGTFLAVALLDLLPDAARSLAWPLALVLAAIGGLLSTWLARLAGGFCPGCSAGGEAADGHEAAIAVTTPLLLVVAFHCALDGLALAGGPARSSAGDWISLAVLAHKIPEGMAIAALCRLSGRSVRGSLGLTAAVEACTFLGYLGALLAGTIAAPLLGAALALTAGSFLFLVYLTLSSTGSSRRPAITSAAALAGFLILAGAQLLAGR